MTVEIHRTALVHPDATVSNGVSIGPFTQVHAGAYIGEGAKVGSHCIIEQGCLLSGPGVELRNYVELRRYTVVGPECYLDSGVKSSGHNELARGVTVRYDAILATGVRVGARTFIAPQVMTINRDHTGEAIGGAQIGEDCHIGTAAVLHPGISITHGTVIGAKALVTKSILEPGTYVGIPARRLIKGSLA